MYKVLIVDDEILTRKALSSIVSGMEEFQVAACVESGEEAVRFCRDNIVHLVFMDIALAGMTGIEAAERISRIHPESYIYVISVLSSFNVVKEALSSKVRGYLVKPVSFSDIIRVLEGFRKDQKEDQDYSLRLLELIHQNQYRNLMDEVPVVVREVFRDNRGNTGRVFSRLRQILNHILENEKRYILEEDYFSGDELEERFPINQVFAEEEMSWNFWLSEVINAIYWQRVIAKHDFMRKVSTFIEEESKRDISLNDICDACSISQSYLSKLFRKYFGISVLDYIHLRKINKAKIYIVLTDYTMTQIGHHAGYNDGSYFSKIFKKYVGMTPMQYKADYCVNGNKEGKTV